MRIRALPSDAVMERTTFKAEKNESTPSCCVLRVWFSLLMKFPSPVTLVIVALVVRTIKVAVKSAFLLKNEN